MDDWYEAGRLTAKVRDYGKKLIKENIKLIDVTENIEKFTLDNNINLAFPIQLSINEIAAHYAAFVNDDIIFKKNDLIKLDIGVCVNGAIGDSAVSVGIGNKWDKLISASEIALNEAIKIVKDGITLGEIGKTIEDAIRKTGFKPIRNLSGHGLNLFMVHNGINIPNYDTKESFKLKEGMVIAIEPFATTGDGLVKDGKDSDIFRLLTKKNVRDINARKLSNYIWEEKKTLPFSKRELLKKFSEYEVNIGLRNLINAGILHSYKHLIEKTNGIVSQTEHSVLIKKDRCEILTI